MDEFRVCFEIEVTGFLDALDVKNEGTDEVYLRKLVMPLTICRSLEKSRLSRTCCLRSLLRWSGDLKHAVAWESGAQRRHQVRKYKSRSPRIVDI